MCAVWHTAPGAFGLLANLSKKEQETFVFLLVSWLISNDLHFGLKLGHFSLKIGHFKNVGAQFRTVERPAESLAAVRLDAWAQGRADAL
jgi:hypothetical protein